MKCVYIVIGTLFLSKYTTVLGKSASFQGAEELARKKAEEWGCEQFIYNQWEGDNSLIKIEVVLV